MLFEKAELESEIESDIREYALRRGWMVMKFVSPGQTGVPDRLFLRRGVYVFIEIKKFGEKPTAKQISKHNEIRRHGGTVHWVDNLEDAKVILK